MTDKKNFKKPKKKKKKPRDEKLINQEKAHFQEEVDEEIMGPIFMLVFVCVYVCVRTRWSRVITKDFILSKISHQNRLKSDHLLLQL